LELLYEIGGTRVYDERKTESLCIMEESRAKKQKIEEMLTFLDQRIAELDKEKEELKGYKDLDSTKRVLEYTLAMKEIADITKKLDSIEGTHQQDRKQISHWYKQTQDRSTDIRNGEKEIKSLNIDLEKLNKEKQVLQDELTELDKNKARLELIVGNYKSNKTDVSKRRENTTSELADLQKEIEKARKSLESIIPSFLAAQQKEQKIKEKIMQNERRLQDLYSKQGWGSRFSSAADRDKWIKKEVKSIENTAASQKEQVDKLKKEIEKIQEGIDTERNLIENIKEIFDMHKKRRDELNKKYNKLKEKMYKFFNKRKELWKEDNELEHELTLHKQVLDKTERQLYSTLPLEQAKGLKAIKRIKKSTILLEFMHP